jgi:hypothetical protein
MNISASERKFLDTYGFIIKKNKPLFYDKEVDIYDQIFVLDNKVEIAHLSGSIGPVFVDKKMLQRDEITNDVLIGLLEKDQKFAVVGRHQLSAFEGYNEKQNENNFKYQASQKIWQDIFKKQFLEDIYLLKEIHCERIVQKMKNFSEQAAQTFHLFENLTEMDIE